MNQKVIKNQNDISIINLLPKRLQQKITAAAVEANLKNAFKADTLVKKKKSKERSSKSKHKHGTFEDVDILVPIYEQDESNVEAVLDAFGRTQMTKSNLNLEGKADATLIPGILRIGPRDATPKTTPVDNSATAREKKRKQKRPLEQQSQKDFVNSPMSPARQIKALAYPIWFDAIDKNRLEQVKEMYDSLLEITKQKTLIKNWSNFKKIHSELLQAYEYLLMNQLKLCCEQKIDTFFWKLLFYNIREYLKNDESKYASPCMLWLIEKGLKFYKGLYENLAAKYLAGERGNGAQVMPQYGSKYEVIARVAAQKILICKGDLCRYKVKQLDTNDYNEAMNYYHEARSLMPSNGIPYNQLAVVSIQMRNKFDAVYFHMRSLMSSNAIYTAKESLMVIFDEIRKKYEEAELKSSPLNKKHANNSNESLRKEVWIHPDGVHRSHRNNINRKNKLVNEEALTKALSSEELLRRFTSTFLYIIGKLYIGVDLDSIQEFGRKLLVLMSAIFKRTPLGLSQSRILKVIALNIFVIEHNKNKKECGRETRYHAFQFSNQVFGLIVRKVNNELLKYIEDFDPNKYKEKSFDDLNTLLQFIKIYINWLSLNVDIWEPVRNEEHAVVDCWLELHSLYKTVANLQKQESEKFENIFEGVILDEDNFLVGFTPLAMKQVKYCKVNLTSPETQFYTRIQCISNFKLVHLENKNLLKYVEEPHAVLESLEIDEVAKNEYKSKSSEGEDSDSDNNENVGVNDKYKSLTKSMEGLMWNRTADDTNPQYAKLLKLRKELEIKEQNELIFHQKMDDIFRFINISYYIEVRPRYLLPDTNCFIDCLKGFENLAENYKHYTLVVPITVVKELDGLSKGIKLDVDEKLVRKEELDHYAKVTATAKKTLQFIRAAKNIKFATSKGSFISCSLFDLVEEDHMSNDDKILATALSLSKNMSTQTLNGCSCVIKTDLVVITTDRNLRVKALMRNLAVTDLSEFLLWIKGCNT